MEETYSISLQTIIDEFSLSTVYLPAPADTIMITSNEVDRPGLALAGFFDLIKKSCGKHEAAAEQEVAQLANAGGGGEQCVDSVFDEAYGDTVNRAETECSQQCGQLGKIHLHEVGDQEWNGKFHQHQDNCDRAEHGGDGQLVGFVSCGHKNTLLCKLTEELPSPEDPCKRVTCAFSSRSSSIQTVTVGTGIAPVQRTCARGLRKNPSPPVGTCTPP